MKTFEYKHIGRILRNTCLCGIAAAGMLTLTSLRTQATVRADQIRFHNEATDTTRITEMQQQVAAMRLATPGNRISALGKMLVGTPYVAHTLEADSLGDGEKLTVNIDQLDCTTFVETVTAMAMTVGSGRTSWRDFVYNLERLRYRGGEMNGYASRLHYICDWVVNNSSRGIVKDVSDRCPSVRYTVKTIDFMSRNRDRYPALADSATYARILNTEQGFHGHRFPYIKSNDVDNKANYGYFQDGDIVALTSTVKNLDVTHMGIVVKDADRVPHLMHASQSLGRVVITEESLGEFLKHNRQFTGVRIIRLQE